MQATVLFAKLAVKKIKYAAINLCDFASSGYLPLKSAEHANAIFLVLLPCWTFSHFSNNRMSKFPSKSKQISYKHVLTNIVYFYRDNYSCSSYQCFHESRQTVRSNGVVADNSPGWWFPAEICRQTCHKNTKCWQYDTDSVCM